MLTDLPHHPGQRPRPAHRLRWLASLLLLLAPWALSAQGVTGVGIAPIRIPDPVNGGQTDGYVFYPSSQPSHATTAIGPYNVAATPDAPALLAPGRLS